jgi:cold shock CspA family protein
VAASRPFPFTEGEGEVVAFDDPRGLGVVRADGGGDLPFHCTAIADGTRTIAVGARVRFRVVPGRLGRWEADQLSLSPARLATST